jgi:thiol-activated cytolysin
MATPARPPSLPARVPRSPRRFAAALLAALGLALAACGDDGAGSGGMGPGADDIDGYLQSLQFDAEAMLNVQDTGSGDRKETQLGAPATTTEWVPSVGEKTCVRTTYSLQQNFDKLAVMRPTQGIVWPGALVKGNESLVDGLPEPLTLARAPITISVDLPGIGANGVKVVESPTSSSVQVAIDEALDWWNKNAYVDGYVNAASSSFKWTSSYSSEQTGLSLGLNLAWATGEVSSALDHSTTSTSHVVTGAFQQAFYTVTFDTPSSPGVVFDPSVRLADVQAQVTPTSPAAYIASVTYGRIIAIRMETTYQATSTDIEGAFQYTTGILNASGSVESRYKQILANSTFTALTLGGNAAVASEVIAGPIASFAALRDAIQGNNAIYSTGNPGVAVSYVVRYLGDNSLARLGSTTEYTATECLLNAQRIRVYYSGMKVLGDCRLFEGYFYWTLGATANGAFTTIDQVTSANARLGDDVVGTWLQIDKEATFIVPKTPGASITVGGTVWEKLSGTQLPGMAVVHSIDNGWSPGWHKKTLATVVGVSSCKVEISYLVELK